MVMLRGTKASSYSKRVCCLCKVLAVRGWMMKEARDMSDKGRKGQATKDQAGTIREPNGGDKRTERTPNVTRHKSQVEVNKLEQGANKAAGDTKIWIPTL